MRKIDRIEILKYFIYACCFLGQELFTSICFIFGYEHHESDPIYLYYMIGLFIITMIFVATDLFKYGSRISFLVFLIPLLYSLAFLIEFSLESSHYEWTTKSYEFFIFFCLPPIFVAGLMNAGREIGFLYKCLDLLMYFIAIGMILSIPQMMASGALLDSYNDIAYLSAVSFGFLYYGLVSNNPDRLKIFNTRLFRIISIGMCFMLIISSLSSGGRGGTVLLFSLIAIISFRYLSHGTLMKFLLLIPVIILAIFIVSSIFTASIFSGILDTGMNRAFSYIGPNGIDMTQTSNRDIAYSEAMERIRENPVSGYGIFHTIGAFGYPHNIFLEILEGGGFIYLFLWVVIFIICFRKAIRFIRIKKECFYLIPLFSYPFVNLMFSSSYMMLGLFWFTIVYLLTLKLKHA